MATIRTPPYKQFITPALHRRFTAAALVILAVSYVEALLIGERTSFFWSWFPIGTAGVKTLLLFISALSVFVLRVAQLHIGKRTAPSPSVTFVQYLFRLDTVQTVFWYFFSAWFFTEVYIWSAAPSADLGWIAPGKAWERRLLNERPIYLRSVFTIFAVVQSALHLYYDYDQVPLSTAVTFPSEPAAVEPVGLIAGLQTQILAQVKPLQPLFWYDPEDIFTSITRNIILRAACVSFLSPFLYTILIRRRAWSWSLAFAKLIWDVPSTPLSFIPPHYPSLIYRSMTSGFFLLLLWDATNILFTVYVAQVPLKKGQPVTAESKDPNGSLLTGLKAQKEVPKAFALWELLHISAYPSPRRTTIFTDIDRPTGSLWTQTFNICLSQISAIHSRIAPPAIISTVPAVVETLPRLTSPLLRENILTAPPKPSTPSERTEALVGNLTKSFGQSPNPGTLKLPTTATTQIRQIMTQKLLPSSPSSTRKLLTGPPTQQPQQLKSGLLALLQSYTLALLRTPLGSPFRRTIPRRARATILGSPLSSYNSIIYSIRILTNLATASLDEDPYGKVAQDIPALIRSFVATIRAIEGFVQGMEVHWTDVERLSFGSSSSSISNTSSSSEKNLTVKKEAAEDIEGVREVLQCLREGLTGLLDGFGGFAAELGLERAEVRVAREVAGVLVGGGKKGDGGGGGNGEKLKGVERREMEQLGEGGR